MNNTSVLFYEPKRGSRTAAKNTDDIMNFTKSLAALVLGAAVGASFAADATPDMFGYAPGAKVMEPKLENGILDTYSVVYSQVKQRRSTLPLEMNLIVPRNKNLKPAIVYFPGGGFTTAEHLKFHEIRTALANAGYVVAACQYRTVPHKFPGLLEDAKAAVRYLRAHAKEYGIDPNRIGMLGDSAGGYVVEMAGTTNGEKTWDKGDYLDQSSDVQAVVSFYGISDLRNIGEGFPKEIVEIHKSPAVTEALLVNGPAFNANPGAGILADPDKALAASPMGHVDGSEPPFLLMHGDKDPLVSPVQSAQLYKKLKENKVDAEYIMLRGAGHGDVNWFQPNVINTVVTWFKQKLGEPKKEALESQKNKTSL
jgi:acetyl esterase/lipase